VEEGGHVGEADEGLAPVDLLHVDAGHPGNGSDGPAGG
jgi:hypothetical protein